MAENTIKTNSLAAFLGSIKFKTNTRAFNEEYPGPPLASLKSLLSTSKDKFREESEFILSDN